MNSDSWGKGNFSNIMSSKHACVNSNNCPNKQTNLSNKETSNQWSKLFQIQDSFRNNEIWFIHRKYIDNDICDCYIYVEPCSYLTR